MNCPAWKISIFANQNQQFLDKLQLLKISKNIESGQYLNIKGQPSEGAFCIAKGNLKISWPNSTPSKESIIKFVSPGDMTGYRCLFSEKNYRGTAIALEPVQSCFISKEILFSLLKENFSLSEEILSRMGKEISVAESRLHSFCQNNVRERLAEHLLILKERCGHLNEDGYLLKIHLKREELASWIGTTKEAVVRTLSEFKTEGLIKQEGKNIIIVKHSLLTEIAGK
jgi:CRP/FNR family transcriptional regulator